MLPDLSVGSCHRVSHLRQTGCTFDIKNHIISIDPPHNALSLLDHITVPQAQFNHFGSQPQGHRPGLYTRSRTPRGSRFSPTGTTPPQVFRRAHTPARPDKEQAQQPVTQRQKPPEPGHFHFKPSARVTRRRSRTRPAPRATAFILVTGEFVILGRQFVSTERDSSSLRFSE